MRYDKCGNAQYDERYAGMIPQLESLYSNRIPESENNLK